MRIVPRAPGGPAAALALAAVVMALLALACKRQSSTGGSEISQSLILSPQTIPVRDGARAVRRISGDGATVTLDGSAAGAGEIKPGSVVLIRDVEVIKAAAVRREGDRGPVRGCHDGGQHDGVGGGGDHPCSRGEVYITGSAGLEAKFLLLTKTSRTTVYQKGIHKANPNIKACQG